MPGTRVELLDELPEGLEDELPGVWEEEPEGPLLWLDEGELEEISAPPGPPVFTTVVAPEPPGPLLLVPEPGALVLEFPLA